MTEATSRGMFSGCGVGLKSSTSGLESIIPVSTSTSPSGWSIVQTNTGKRSPSTRSSAARCARITWRLYHRGPARHRPARPAPRLSRAGRADGPQRDPVQQAPEGQAVPWLHRDPAHRCPAAAVAMLVVRGRRPDPGFEGTIWDIPPRRASSESADGVVTVQLSPAEFEALRRIQTLDPADELLVYRSRHVGGLIEVSGTEDDLRSLAGVIADEVADEASARRRADLKATFDRI